MREGSRSVTLPRETPQAPPADPALPRTRGPMPLPAPPGRGRLLLPKPLRQGLQALGWWIEPRPLKPSAHLEQTRRLIAAWGWCQSLDVSPTGRLCIRGAQGVLERTGHVTPTARAQAVEYMEHVLRTQEGWAGSFFTWNDLPGNSHDAVDSLLRRASRHAHERGH